MSDTKGKLSLNIEETDPKLVPFFQIAQDAYDVLEQQLRQIGLSQIRSGDGEAQAVRQWTLYAGTLFGEVMIGCVQLSLFHMPRVQHSLNRQLFEYYIRNRWMIKHPRVAQKLFNSLPRAAKKEVTQAPLVLTAERKAVIERNEEEWALNNPDLAAQAKEENLKSMCEDILGDSFQRDYFWLYTMPSLIVHAKPLGIPDVISITNGKQKERNPNSNFLDRVDELTKTIGIALQYAACLAVKFQLDQKPACDLNVRFDKALRDSNIVPEAVPLGVDSESN